MNVGEKRIAAVFVAPAVRWALVTLGMMLVSVNGALALGAEKAARKIAANEPNVSLAPYVWKCSGSGPAVRAEATMPGAYLKVVFQNSPTLGLIVDGTANQGCPAASMPVVEYSVDDGPFKIVPLTKQGEIYTLPLAEGLDGATPHRLELYFRAADLFQNRWRASTAHLRIAGIELAADGSLLSCPQRSKRAIGFGDSIFEGVGVDGLFTSWQLLGVSNARATWFPIVCAGLDCEYGQLGAGGQGMATKLMAMPPLPETWDHYDAATSRLAGKLLLPEPDYVFCGMGTNDFQQDISRPIDITKDYTRWLTAVRAACPNARIFCVVPPLGWHAAEIQAAVAARHKADDRRVHLIDTAPLRSAFRSGNKPTRLAYDGVHPTIYANALLGSLIAVEVQKVLDSDGR
jgi:hypothetical protein